MRFLLFLLIVAGAGAGAFYYSEPVREKVRSFRVSDADRERYEAYERGKAIFRSSWPEAASAHFQAWGDDEGETAGPVNADGVSADVWMVRGHLTMKKDGAEVQEQWCQAFNRATGANGGMAVDHQAEDTLHKLDSGELRKKPAQTASSAPGGAPAATPAPSGSWMWNNQGRSALDQPLKKGGS